MPRKNPDKLNIAWIKSNYIIYNFHNLYLSVLIGDAWTWKFMQRYAHRGNAVYARVHFSPLTLQEQSSGQGDEGNTKEGGTVTSGDLTMQTYIENELSTFCECWTEPARSYFIYTIPNTISK